MRSLASFLAQSDPDILALSEVESGDALVIATRFARQWAYRGGEALFWKHVLDAPLIEDRYLPAPAANPFERRGFLTVRGRCHDMTMRMVVTSIIGERDARIRRLRYARGQLRGDDTAVVFARLPSGRTGFSDLGFFTACASAQNDAILVRNLVVRQEPGAERAHDIIGVPLQTRIELTVRV